MTRFCEAWRSTRVAIGAIALLVAATVPVRAQVPPDPVVASAPPAGETPAPKPAASRPVADVPPLDLSDHAIQKAIADSKELMDGLSAAPRSNFGGGRGKVAAYGQQRIDQDFKDAEIPSCLTTDAFKFDPPVIGPFTFSGFAALPVWAHAIASGGCRF